MRRVLALGASICLFSAADDALAATFTPDMWVYEVTFTAVAVTPTTLFSWSDAAPMDEAVPDGCTPHPNDDGTQRISCVDRSIDLLATMDEPLKATYLTRVQTVGFNASTVVCSGPVIAGCPSDGRSTEPYVYSYEGSYLVRTLDAAEGLLSFCGWMYMSSTACYDLTADGGTASAGGTAVTLTGTWDAVTGGRWVASGDPYLAYTGTGLLVSRPTADLTESATLSAGPPIVVTPLPAPILMLMSAFVGLAGLALRDRRRQQPAA